MPVAPIKPSEVTTLKKTLFPDFVIETWNKVIAKNFSDGSSIVYQNEIVDMLVVAGDVPRGTVFNSNWLEIEDIYKSAGWKVSYDKPGFGETYEATFEFTPKRK